MKITKYEHACVVVEDQDRLLVIDPGKFSVSYTPSDRVEAVVITHIHSDHFDHETLKKIKELNPNAEFYSTAQVAKEAPELAFEAVSDGTKINVGPFKIAFFGGNHELYQGFENVGVLVNDSFYYPGDSYSLPDKQVSILGTPASAPWLRVTEASQFIKDVHAKTVFPMHNMLLSPEGEEIHYRILAAATEESGGRWTVLKPGDSTEV